MSTIQDIPISTICTYLAKWCQKCNLNYSWEYVATYSDFTHTFKNQHGLYCTFHIYDPTKRNEFIQYVIDNIDNTPDEYLELPLNSVAILRKELENMPYMRNFNLYNYLCRHRGFNEKYTNIASFRLFLERCKTSEILSQDDINQVKYIIHALGENAANIIDGLINKKTMQCDLFSTKAERMKNVRILYVG